MKVCTITCNNADNYGARLQAYALARYIQSLGHEVEIIDYDPYYTRFNLKKLYWPGLSIKGWGRMLLQYDRRCTDIRKHQRLEDFSKAYTQLTDKYLSLGELTKNPPAADIYVAGSDQIWNTNFENGRDAAYYLNFGPDSTRRISYAASFAIPSVDDNYKKSIKDWLSRLDAISVRESSAVDIVKEMGCDATVVSDPAFLLSADEWQSIAEPVETKPYLLIYDFECSKQLRKVAKRIARARGLKIYSVSPVRQRYVDRNYSDCSPNVFLGLLKSADCVLSNSLHGSIFSMIFERDFYVVNRKDGLNLRMSQLLEHYDLLDRLINTDSDKSLLTAHIDYSKISDALSHDIEQSKAWLRSNLLSK